jgi:ribonuclease J
MSNGEHRHVKLKEQDTVVLASSPIPYSGNDALIRAMVDDFLKKGVHVFRHETRDLDGIGPLHVSGHASRDEYADMIQMTQPKFFIPIYGDFTAKKYHVDLAVEQGIPRASTVNVGNGEVIALTPDKMEVIGEVPNGTILVDQTGAIVNNIVVKDRVLLAEEGLVAIILTVDKKNGNLLTSPDIISRGFIYMRDSEELMTGLRFELKRAVQQRFKRIELDRFKTELKDHLTHYLFEHTGRSPIIIPVVNVIGGSKNDIKTTTGPQRTKDSEDMAVQQQKRFEEMRARLLTQDSRVD